MSETVENIWNKGEKIDLNDVPLYSPWPSRLLGLTTWSRGERTLDDIEREFNKETYTDLLSVLKACPEISTPEELFSKKNAESGSYLCVRHGEFRRLEAANAEAMKNSLICSIVKRFLPARAIVDLGAGTGGIAMKLASDLDCHQIPIFALEKMEYARKIISFFSNKKNYDLTVGDCDLFSSPITREMIPEGAIIITNSVVYLGGIATCDIVDELIKLKPKAILHFEPFASFFDQRTIYGQLCIAYAHMNRHNMIFDRDLLAMNGDKVTIIDTMPCIYGNNPFFPISMVAWAPT